MFDPARGVVLVALERHRDKAAEPSVGRAREFIWRSFDLGPGLAGSGGRVTNW